MEKSVNSPILLMMGAVVDDALRRLLSKDESFAAAAGWMSGGGRVGVLVFQLVSRARGIVANRCSWA